jgi:hypothetical protein
MAKAARLLVGAAPRAPRLCSAPCSPDPASRADRERSAFRFRIDGAEPLALADSYDDREIHSGLSPIDGYGRFPEHGVPLNRRRLAVLLRELPTQALPDGLRNSFRERTLWCARGGPARRGVGAPSRLA